MRDIKFRGKRIDTRRMGIWFLFRARHIQFRKQKHKKRFIM